MSSRVAVLVGNRRSEGALELPDLRGPQNDIQNLAPVLRDPELGGFDVHAVIDATTPETIDAIEEGLRQAGREGLFLLYFSGWGVLDGQDRLYLATGDTRLQSLSTTAISTKFLRHLLEYSVCERAIVILDCCFTGAASGQHLTMKVSDELRQIRAKGGATVAVLASSPRVQSPESRESDHAGGRRGILTSLLVEGLRSGAADQDGDGEVTVGNLGEFLGLRMPKLCPTWLADADGDALLVSACPESMPGVVARADVSDSPPLTRQLPGRRWSVSLAVLCLVAAVAVASFWFASSSDSPLLASEIQRDDLASLDLEVAGIVREQLLTRQLAANAGWVEHPVDSWQALDSYPGATWVNSASQELGAAGRIILPYGGQMDLELSDGTHGIGILSRRRMNVAAVLVRLSNGEELRFDIATHYPADVFCAFLAPVSIAGIRLEGRRGSLEIDRLFFYADREQAVPRNR